MGHTIASDAELLAASQRGERAAFGALVERYQRLVCAVTYSRTRDEALAEDVAQDTFLAAWPRLGQVREPDRLGGWLCGIARNLARKARRRRDREVPLPADPLVAADDPFTAVSAAQADDLVRAALARVPDTYRDVLVLYYREQRSAEDVARMLGISVAATLQRLARGRAYLAQGVAALVERSLAAQPGRSRRNLAAAVLAALPVAVVPSHADASPATGGHMYKLAIAAVALTGATTAVVVRQTHDASSPSTTPPPAVMEPRLAPTTPPPPPSPSPTQRDVRTASAPLVSPPSLPPQLPRASAEPLSPTQLAQLGLDRGPSVGPANARVTVVMFTDPQCTYCGRAYGTIDQLLDEYPSDVRLIVKQLPVHESSRLLAQAAYAAEAQNRFWELHDLMYAYEDDLSRDSLVALAEQARLDVRAFTAALDAGTYANAVAADQAAAKSAQVRATPSFLINGKQIEGALPVEVMRAEIDAALAN